MSNYYFTFEKIFYQVVSILLGSDPASYIANFSYNIMKKVDRELKKGESA